MLVVAGAFNPAIFTPQWIAAVLYEIPEGQDVDGIMVADTAGQTIRPYINKVGILAESERLSIAIDDINQDDLSRCEAIIRRLANALPHTPANGVGVNFRFETTDFDADIVQMLSPSDEPTKVGVVSRSSILSAIVTDDCILNLQRGLYDAKVVIDFNFHKDIEHMNILNEIFNNDRIFHLYNRAINIIELLYRFDCDDIEFIRALT